MAHCPTTDHFMLFLDGLKCNIWMKVPNMSSQEIIKHVSIVLASMQCNVQNGFTAFNQHNGLLGKTFGRYRTEKLVFALM